METQTQAGAGTVEASREVRTYGGKTWTRKPPKPKAIGKTRLTAAMAVRLVQLAQKQEEKDLLRRAAKGGRHPRLRPVPADAAAAVRKYKASIAALPPAKAGAHHARHMCLSALNRLRPSLASAYTHLHFYSAGVGWDCLPARPEAALPAARAYDRAYALLVRLAQASAEAQCRAADEAEKASVHA